MNPPGRSMDDLARSMSSLARRAVEEYEPLVESIILDPSPGISEVERTLDGLLDFCFDPRASSLYRKLCRRYFAIDPTATFEYIRAYREMWDPEQETPRQAE
ncbi:hypothetical protein [Paludisphaera mucosa]|uniref:Uncharacterized protein n=1 Tax=Paludisphaera mucosa TaxID=3030827 RepID=A0ABT6FLJ2_9BACT|nr:hypothetical protein [Paludisphaera mucosa]MDG3008417.1 hypothetical protein [Paludisphaera mucosa]